MTDKAKVTTALSILNDPSLSYAKKRRRGLVALADDPPVGPEVIFQAQPGVKPFTSTNGDATYDPEFAWDGYFTLRCFNPSGGGIARGWINPMPVPAAIGDERWIGAEFLIPEPSKHVWTGIMRLSHWDGVGVYSILEVVLESGMLNVYCEDYPIGNGASHHLIADVPCPVNRRFHLELGALINDDIGWAELMVDGNREGYESVTPTITQPHPYTMAQFGLGTVANGPVTVYVAKPTLARGRLGAI